MPAVWHRGASPKISIPNDRGLSQWSLWPLALPVACGRRKIFLAFEDRLFDMVNRTRRRTPDCEHAVAAQSGLGCRQGQHPGCRRWRSG